MLKNKTVLITGGGSGIGLALAAELLEQDNTVIICGRSEAKLNKAQQVYPTLHTYNCDVTDSDAVNSMFSSLTQKGMFPDVLVNNAAVFHVATNTSEITLDLIRSEVATNITAPMLLSVDFIKRSGDKPALIINIGSLSAWLPLRTQAVYAATKAALHLFTVALRDLLAMQGSKVRVHEVMTPAVDTGMVSAMQMDKLPANVLADKILKAVNKGKEEIIIGSDARLVSVLHRLAPGLIKRMANKRAERAMEGMTGTSSPLNP